MGWGLQGTQGHNMTRASLTPWPSGDPWRGMRCSIVNAFMSSSAPSAGVLYKLQPLTCTHLPKQR